MFCEDSMWWCRFLHYDQQPKRSQLCQSDWPAVHWRTLKVSKAHLENSCPGHIQSARCLQNILGLLCTPWTVACPPASRRHEVLPGFAIQAWYQWYNVPWNHWIDCGSGSTWCVTYMYFSLENPTQDHCCFTNGKKKEYVKVRVIRLLIPPSQTKDREAHRCLAIAVSTCSTCSW